MTGTERGISRQQQLGAEFRLRDFNDALLAEGPLPLTMLERRIGDWTAARAGGHST